MQNSLSNSVHCRELMTPRNNSGILNINEYNIELNLYSYDFDTLPNSIGPLFLQTSRNEIVSLYEVTFLGKNRSWRNGPTPIACYHQRIVSDFAVVGHDRWLATNSIRSVHFLIDGAGIVFELDPRQRDLILSKIMQPDVWSIFKIQRSDLEAGLSYRAAYSAHFNAIDEYPSKKWVSFSVISQAGLSIGSFIEPVLDFVSFFSFCLCRSLRPSDIRIDRLLPAEVDAAVAADAYMGDHRVHFLWEEERGDDQGAKPIESPFLASNECELEALSSCVLQWTERAQEWRKANALMEKCFRSQNVISPDRLLNAHRWLEEIPLAKQLQAITNDDIYAIANAADIAARERGISSDINARIRGAIKMIKKESALQRFQRVVWKIEERINAIQFPQDFVSMLVRSQDFRGKVAHGAFRFKNDEEMECFRNSLYALEALCYLLTAIDLPISEAGLVRMMRNPIVRRVLNS